MPDENALSQHIRVHRGGPRDELHALRTCIAGEHNREVLAGIEISINKIEKALARFCMKRHTMEVTDHV